jgi:hypothetical protein
VAGGEFFTPKKFYLIKKKTKNFPKPFYFTHPQEKKIRRNKKKKIPQNDFDSKLFLFIFP